MIFDGGTPIRTTTTKYGALPTPAKPGKRHNRASAKRSKSKVLQEREQVQKSYSVQADVEWDLFEISYSPLFPMRETADYYYDSAAGFGNSIYLIGSGASPYTYVCKFY